MNIIGIFSESFWYIAPILMSLTVTLTGAINKMFGTTNATWKQITSWLVGIALSIIAYFAGVISFGQPQWLGVLMLCIVVGLSSNGLYDIPTIKAFINSLFPTTIAKK